MKLRIFIALSLLLVVVSVKSAFAQAVLPKFTYLGGNVAGDPIGKKLSHVNGNQKPNFIVKRQSRPGSTVREIHFAFVQSTATGTYTVQDSCWGTGSSRSCIEEDVWETDIKNAANVPYFYRPSGNDIIVPLGTATKNCVVSYVTIDDAPNGQLDGFYITSGSLPTQLSHCPAQSSTTQSTPVYCSQEGMVVEGSFTSPRSGNLYIVSEDSLGLAAVETCAPPPPNETDFSGFLWEYDDPTIPGSSCTENANASQRRDCDLDTNDLQNNVELQFFLENDTNELSDTLYYPSTQSFSKNNLLLDGNKVRICVRMTQMVHPNGGTYTLSFAHVNGTKIGTSTARCTAYFTPPNPNGSNEVQLAFKYEPPAFEAPWYVTLNGDVYAGDDHEISDQTFPSAPSGGFSSNLINGTGFALGDAAVLNQFAENGIKVTNFTNSSQWPTTFPPTYTSATNWTGASTISEGVYNLTVAELNSWLNSTSSYTVTGSSNLAILQVAGSGDININKNITANGNSRIIIIAPDATVFVNAGSGIGSSGITATSSSNVDLGLIIGGAINFVGDPSNSNVNSLVYSGFMANYGGNYDITFAWDSHANNATLPSTAVRYDPGYIFALQDLELSGVSTQLTHFDLTWEVLD